MGKKVTRVKKITEATRIKEVTKFMKDKKVTEAIPTMISSLFNFFCLKWVIQNISLNICINILLLFEYPNILPSKVMSKLGNDEDSVMKKN